MRGSWLVCVLWGAMAWAQAAPGAQAPVPQGPGMPKPPVALPETAASVSDNAAVITVKGVCPAPAKPAAAKGATVKPTSATTKTAAADCKTVVTKAEFEKLANAVSPNVTPQLKKQLAGVLPKFIAMSDAAKKQGLDKTPQFAETVKFAKMQILTQELQRKIQADAAKVPESEIAAYYKEHADSYEQFSLDRLFVPRNKQVQPEAKDKEDEDKDEKLTDEQKKEKEKEKEAEEKTKTEQGEADMTKLAETLRERAVAGEDFAKLQKEAFEAAGMKIESPTVTLPKVRRTGLPPAHAAVFDLKVGEVSQVISDSGGHYIYKVDTKDQLTLDQARQEIQTALQSKRTKDMLDKVNGSFQVETNEAYFGPMTPAIPPGRGGISQHMPNPRTPPGPVPATPNGSGAPAQPPAQTVPPAQSQDSKPN
jgi:parvulin-like peptidyl-prolyl isomerase